MQLQGTMIIKKIHILSWLITGKLSQNFPGLINKIQRFSRTAKKFKTFAGCGKPVQVELTLNHRNHTLGTTPRFKPSKYYKKVTFF